MTTILEKIAHFLKQQGIKYVLDSKNNQIITGTKSHCLEKLLIIISLEEEGNYLTICLPKLITNLKAHPYKGKVFETMLTIASQNKMLRWEYDPIVDQVNAKIEFPLEDSVLTEKQFDRCFYGIIELVDQVAMPRLQQVMITGVDPNEEEIGERILLKLEEQLPQGYLSVIEQALSARKKRGKL